MTDTPPPDEPVEAPEAPEGPMPMPTPLGELPPPDEPPLALTDESAVGLPIIVEDESDAS